MCFIKRRVSIHHKQRLHSVGYYNSLYHIQVIPQYDFDTALDMISKQIWHDGFEYIGMKCLENMAEDKLRV